MYRARLGRRCGCNRAQRMRWHQTYLIASYTVNTEIHTDDTPPVWMIIHKHQKAKILVHALSSANFGYRFFSVYTEQYNTTHTILPFEFNTFIWQSWNAFHLHRQQNHHRRTANGKTATATKPTNSRSTNSPAHSYSISYILYCTTHSILFSYSLQSFSFTDAPLCVTDKVVIVGAFRNENLNIYCEVQADPPPRYVNMYFIY